jgi:hypothetical protein
MRYLLEEADFEPVDTEKAQEIIKISLTNSYYQQFHYYIDCFEINLLNEIANYNIEMCFSDFRLSNKEKWKELYSSYPFNLPNFCGEQEPAKGFLLTLLTQFLVTEIEIIDGGSVLLRFDNEYDIRVEGEVEIADVSWTITIYREGVRLVNIMCSFNEIYGTILKNYLI